MALGSVLSASTDLGLGQMLSDQQKTETDEEKRKKRLGMASAATGGNPFNYGMTGVASVDLGMRGAGR